MGLTEKELIIGLAEWVLVGISIVTLIGSIIISLKFFIYSTTKKHWRAGKRAPWTTEESKGCFRDNVFPCTYHFMGPPPGGLEWVWIVTVDEMEISDFMRLPSTAKAYIPTIREARLSFLRMLSSIDYPMADVTIVAMEAEDANS